METIFVLGLEGKVKTITIEKGRVEVSLFVKCYLRDSLWLMLLYFP